MIASACSKGTSGVLDTGATKTVVGSDHVKELIESFDPTIRQQLKRSQCKITFRFGNQATLEASTALVVPIGKLLLQIAIVPGGTPFLISNSLIRVLKCCIDVDRQEIRSPLLSQAIPLELTPKGLFLIDINQLAIHARIEGRSSIVYHVHDHHSQSSKSNHVAINQPPLNESKTWPKDLPASRDCCDPTLIHQHDLTEGPSSPTAGASSTGGSTIARDDSRGIGVNGSEVRKHSSRQNFRSPLAAQSGLDQVHGRPLQQVDQGGSQVSPDVHRKESHPCRKESGWESRRGRRAMPRALPNPRVCQRRCPIPAELW